MPLQRIQPQGLPEAPTYTHVVRAGNTLYIAGQTGQNEKGEVVGDDIVTQTTQVMENLRLALASAGASFEHLVKITVFVTDARFRETLGQVRKQYLGDLKPASTFVVVAGLADPRYLVEIEGIAVLD